MLFKNQDSITQAKKKKKKKSLYFSLLVLDAPS
jgi:hypothetical protein